MSSSFREPFFLRGHRSVLQRAVRMSLVLAGLSSCAAWAVLFFFLFEFRNVYLERLAFGLPFAVLIHGPLNFWARRSWFWSAAVIPLGFWIATAPVVFAVFYIGRGGSWEVGFEFSWLSHFLTTCAIRAGVQGVLLVKRDLAGIVAFALAVLSGALAGTAGYVIAAQGPITIPGVRSDIVPSVKAVCILSLWFAALTVPWGIRFWWPQDAEPVLPCPLRLPPCERTPVVAFVALKRFLFPPSRNGK